MGMIGYSPQGGMIAAAIRLRDAWAHRGNPVDPDLRRGRVAGVARSCVGTRLTR
jgi:hypothetical protein